MQVFEELGTPRTSVGLRGKRFAERNFPGFILIRRLVNFASNDFVKLELASSRKQLSP